MVKKWSKMVKKGSKGVKKGYRILEEVLELLAALHHLETPAVVLGMQPHVRGPLHVRAYIWA